MKKLFCLALAFIALVSANVLKAQDIATKLIEDGGSGPYKAIMATDESLQTHTYSSRSTSSRSAADSFCPCWCGATEPAPTLLSSTTAS